MAGADHALEETIARALDAGDVNAVATHVVRGYGPQILGYLTAVLRDEDRAAEAFSMFSEDLWRGLPGFERKSSLRTWAYKIAWHAALRVANDPARKRGVPLGTSMASALAEEVRSATAPHLRTDVKTEVQRLRESLSAEEQTLLILRVDRNLEWRDVSQVLDADEATLRKRFERLKEKLKKLAKQGKIDER